MAFDEDRGANSPAAPLYGNRIACHTALLDSSCAWSSLSLCRRGFQVPQDTGIQIHYMKCCSVCTEFTHVLCRPQVTSGLLTTLNVGIRGSRAFYASNLGRNNKDSVLSLASLCMCVTGAECLSCLHSRRAMAWQLGV